MTSTDSTPTRSNLPSGIAADLSEAKAQAADDPQRLATLHAVEEGLHMWQERDKAVAFVRQLAPAPTLPCPSWCGLEAGHHWEGYEGDDGGRLIRWHERHLLPEQGRASYATVRLTRTDETFLTPGAGQERVSGASRVDVEVHGDGGGSPVLTADEAFTLATVLAEASVLLQEAHAAGDPTMGTSDVEWQRKLDEGTTGPAL